MKVPLAVVAIAPALAACSLVYNPNNLPSPPIDAVSDGPPDAALVLDSDAMALVLLDVHPATIDEGQGDFGSLPAVVVVHGHQIVDGNLKVLLVPPAGVTVMIDPITDAKVSFNHDYLAFTVTAHVDETLVADVPLEVWVTQDVPGGSPVTQMLPNKLTLHGLPELKKDSPGVNMMTRVVTPSALQGKYSKVDLHDLTPLTFATGDSIAQITAVSSLEIGDASASGNGPTPGPGGFAGGSAADGAGGALGGKVGSASAGLGLGGGGGGGGGGYVAAGTGGTGGTGLGPGAGGGGGSMNTDNPSITSFATARGGGGGGGGTGGVLNGTAGAPGGGAGGMLVLDAGGDLTTHALTANGGQGGAGGGSSGGAGGGGAGGTIVVRTDHGVLATGALSVAGGVHTGNGGEGSIGRARWDAPAGSPPAGAASHRGPSFVAPMRVFTSDTASLDLVGTVDDGVSVRTIDDANVSHDSDHASFNNAGVAAIAPALSPGYNQVCVKLDGGAQGNPAAEKCVGVAYLP